MRIVVLGAGVMGLSTAYRLALRKAGQITVIDKGPVGDGSSSRAAGIITGHLWTETGVKVRKRSLALYRELSRTLPGYTFRESGCLNLFDPGSWATREPLLPLYDRFSIPYQVMDAAEIGRRWPAIHVPEDWLGLFDPLGGYSEPDEYIAALRTRLQQLGVEIRERELVTDLKLERYRIKGVQTTQGFLPADMVVSTVFAWTRALLQTIGVDLPVKNFVHQRYLTGSLFPAIHVPAVNANPRSVYFRPSRNSAILAGLETSEREEHPVEDLGFQLLQLQVSGDVRQRLKANLTPLVPALSAAEWISEKIGLITFSLDGEPIVGPVPGISGLILAVAFHSGGFAYNPAMGELLSEYVMDGKPHTAPIESWLLDRFSQTEVSAYLKHRIKQRDVTQRRH